MSEGRLTWAQIQEKYPHMYVGLYDVEYEADERVKSAIVKYAGEKEPEDQHSGEDISDFLAGLHSDLVVRYTTLDEDDPLGYLNPHTVKSGGERLTWKEIVRRYPHQNVGLVEIEYGCNEATVASAVVKCTDRDTDPDDMAIMALRGEILMEYTTYDEDFPIEFLQDVPDTLTSRKTSKQEGDDPKIEEDWDEEDERIWEDAPTKRHPEPYEMERWRTEQELVAVFDSCGTTDRSIDEICDMTDGLPWFWQEPLLHRYAARHASKHGKKLREAFQRADDGAHKLAAAVQQSNLRPPISDWKSFFQSADAWKVTLQGLSAEHVIVLWNYYLIESAYVSDFEREWHCWYVLAHCDEEGIDKFLRGWPPSKILNALWYAGECSLRSAPDAMWFTMDDKTLEDALHGGTLEEAAASVVDMKILSGYLAMRALDIDTILGLARDATSCFEKDMPHLERTRS